MKLCSIKEVFGQSALTRINWIVVNYRKYDVNVTVNIITEDNTGLMIIGMLENSYGQSVKYESFFVLAFYVGEVTLRHVHIQGRNTTNKTMTCNF